MKGREMPENILNGNFHDDTAVIRDIFVLTDDYCVKHPNSNAFNVGMIAYVDLATNELKINEHSLLLLNAKTKNYRISDKIETNCIYHIKAYYVKSPPSFGSGFDFAVTEIIEKNASNTALNHLLEKYNTPFKITDNMVGNIIFSRCHWGFNGTFHYCGQQIELTVEKNEIWTEKIKQEQLDTLHILLNYLKDMRTHIPDNINKQITLHSLWIPDTSGFQSYVVICFHTPLNQETKITLEIWTYENDNEPIDLVLSKQELFKFLDAWNTSGNKWNEGE